MSENEEIEFGKIYTLDNPMFLKAQNSMNRSGYGTYYNNRGELVQQGTLYGETTYYLVTGFILGPLIYTDFYKN